MKDVLPPKETYPVFGHDQAERIFARSVETGRLGHAWILAGPKGIGKAALAYQLARRLLAATETDPFPEVTPAHPVFRQISNSVHNRLHIIERGLTRTEEGRVRKETEAGETGSVVSVHNRPRRKEIVVSDIREAGRFLSLSAAGGGWRVVIVDAADEMNTNAANALLKILEEPPSRAMILLVSHNPESLLPTIRSRCQFLPLTPLADTDVQTLLKTYLPDLSEEDRQALTLLVRGSIGRALEYMKTDGLEAMKTFVTLFSKAPDVDLSAVPELAEKTADDPEKFQVVCDLLLAWTARVVRTASNAPPEAPLFEGEGEALTCAAAMYEPEVWAENWFDLFDLYQQTTRLNLEPRQALVRTVGLYAGYPARGGGK